MHRLKPLPTYLLERYQNWKSHEYADYRDTYEKLATEGQHPRAMVISCCDSRVQTTSLFGGDPGEFFVHRNVANLVPPYDPSGDSHGTSAAVEYAVTALEVSHLIVLGHSQCGGVKGCLDKCKGSAPALEAPDSFVGKWIDLLAPKFPEVADIADEQEQINQFERLAVQTSIENLFSFPFVLSRFEAGTLSLHGLWIDIRNGRLEFYQPETGHFEPV